MVQDFILHHIISKIKRRNYMRMAMGSVKRITFIMVRMIINAAKGTKVPQTLPFG